MFQLGGMAAILHWSTLRYFHFSKSISHHNLTPTSQGLEPHVYRAIYNAYTNMHVLDAQLHVETGDIDPMAYRFTIENGHLLPSTLWKTLNTRWCMRSFNMPLSSSPSRFCKCQKTTSVNKIITIDDTLESVIILTSLPQWVGPVGIQRQPTDSTLRVIKYDPNNYASSWNAA